MNEVFILRTEQFFDDYFEAKGKPWPWAEKVIERLHQLSKSELVSRQKAGESAFMQMGITFGVYGDQRGLEKVFPFDIIPRIVNAKDWDLIDRGIKQRINALNKLLPLPHPSLRNNS